MNIYGYNLSDLNQIGSNFENIDVFIGSPYEKFSKRTALSSLADYFNDRFQNQSGLSSMAFQEKNDYAVDGHIHSKYTSVDYVPAGNPSETSFAAVHISSGQNVKTVQMQIPAPNNTAEYTVVPEIGTLKFMANPRISPKLTSDPNFDGWIFPGQTITCTAGQFKDASIVYAGKTDATSFTVPAISDFIKICTDPDEQNACVHNDFCRTYPSHTHEHAITADLNISYDPDDNKEFKLYTQWQGTDHKIPTLPGASTLVKSEYNSQFETRTNITPKYVHAGASYGEYTLNKDGKTSTISVGDSGMGWLSVVANSTAELNFNNINCIDNSYNTVARTAPDHFMIPVLVYIGLP